MQKGWSILFGVVLAATFVLTAVAPFMNWWLPKQVSSYGGDVDYLFYVILALTGFFFVLTEVLLVWFMWKYAYDPARKSVYVEGNHKLEIFWTAVPAAILLWIAFAQINAWERIKYQSRMPDQDVDVVLQVTARQWEWRMRYAANVALPGGEAARRGWAESPQIDDIRIPNELHTWKDANVKIYLKTQDVLHSFFLPNLRLKQDALPGKTIPMWFKAIETNVSFKDDFDPATGRWKEPTAENDWEIACAELCGGGHFRMRGRLYVHPTKKDFLDWHTYVKKRQSSHEPEKAAGTQVTAR